MSLEEARSYPHFFFVPTWKSRLEGYEVHCTKCSEVYEVEINRYRKVAEYDTGFHGLVEKTRPEARAEVAERQERGKRVARGIATPGEREAFMKEALLSVEQVSAKCRGSWRMDKTTAIWLLVTVLLSSAIFIGAVFTEPFTGAQRSVLIAGFTVLGLGILGAVILAATSLRRLLKKKIYPKVVKRLSPAAPDRQELERILRNLEEEGATIGRRLKAKRIVELMPASSREMAR